MGRKNNCHAFGLVYTSRGIFALPAPYLGGLLWDKFSPAAPYVISIFACLLLSGLSFWKLRAPRSEIPVAE